MIGWKEEKLIEEAVDNLAYSKVKRFYPTYICKVTKIPLENTFSYLLDLVEKGILILMWEIRCPDYNCNSVVHRINEINIYSNKYIQCKNCEEEILVAEDNVFPVFEIDEEYRKYIRDKKKRKNLLKAL
ncbi:hypothetical protein P9D60_20815 [Bacillus spizizenii]|uniref:hypothetical protein n=1 Tax=Bacillus subtilis group TaxID=653685 RepID=UPI000FF8F171|nr:MULTISPECIES: hypothetical protein [Bacillus subtilis group]MEC1599885.1 hypothetical protein [Bacillus spizizenii]MEC1643556.1 hypothetical protein [Bacillus spizizenii]QAS08647.1 hypothetical protein EQI48_13200 [Bacillus subtilis]